MFTATTWADIAAGDTILARDGRRVLIRGRPLPSMIITKDGMFNVDPHSTALRIDATDIEAVMTLISAFPDAKLVR